MLMAKSGLLNFFGLGNPDATYILEEKSALMIEQA